MDYINSLKNWIVGTLWPERCAACGRIGAFACRSCLMLLSAPAYKSSPGVQSRIHLDLLLVCAVLTGTAEAFVHALKYRGVRSLAHPLADRMCDLAGTRRESEVLFSKNPLIVPVPLHKSRIRERGYNQAYLLALRIAQNTAMSVNNSSLMRLRPTGQQTKTASRAERLNNMRGAFAVSRNDFIAGRDIVLIDDITTTGATLDDCARALKESGAKRVSALVFARG